MTGRGYGCLPSTPDGRDYLAAPSAPYTGAFVDLSAGFPERPYNQLSLGSCVSNGTAAAVDFARAKMGLAPFRCPSRLFVYYQGRVRAGYPLTEDTGLQIRDGFTVIAKDGVPPELDWAYDITRFAEQPPVKAYADAKLDVAIVYGQVMPGDIDAVIASGHPVVFGFTVYASFESPEVAATGVMPIPDPKTERNLGGHCVVATSTLRDGRDIPHGIPGVLYRKCRNSWGHDGTWGTPDDPGHFWMPARVFQRDASDFWQVTTVSDSGQPVPPPPAPPSFPGALVAAVQGLAGDSQVAAWLAQRHRGVTGVLAAKVTAVLAAPRS